MISERTEPYRSWQINGDEKGVREALAAKEKVIVPKRDLSEEQKEELDRKLQQTSLNDMITVEYFTDGEYIQITGMVSRIDESSRVIKVVNTAISFDDISDIQGELFLEEV